MFDYANISEANEVPGSQRQQMPGDARPLSAIIDAARWHIRPCQAPSRDLEHQRRPAKRQRQRTSTPRGGGEASLRAGGRKRRR